MWPHNAFTCYREKAAKAKAVNSHPYGRDLVTRFADLFEHGTAEAIECPSKACRRWPGDFAAWVEQHTVRQLEAHILTAADDEFMGARKRRLGLRLFAMRAAGWSTWVRRGDVIVMRGWRKAWVGMRTK